MAAYKDLVGQKITKVTSNPGEPKTGQMWYNSTDGKLRGLGIISAWSSSSPMTFGREWGSSGIGTQAANIVAGGYDYNPDARTAQTEEYNGSGWENITNINVVKYVAGGTGSTTAGLVFGGSSPPFTADTEEWNGSSWSEQNNMGTARSVYCGAGGPGGQTAGLAAAGYNGSNVSNVEEYNGTSWSEVNNMSTARRSGAAFGTQTAASYATGYVSANVNTVENYDGTNWTTGTSTNVAKNSAGSSAMSQTSAVVFGGNGPGANVNTNESWDGTSWSVAPTLATGRSGINGAGSGTAALAASGFTSPPDASPGITEEFNVSTNTITAAAWSSGGNLNTGRQDVGGTGTKSAGLAMGGRTGSSGPFTQANNSEEYDGTSWTEGNNLNTARGEGSGAGTQTAAVYFGGAPDSNATENYNGTSWTTSPGTLNTGRSSGASFGASYTSAVFCGGYGGARIANVEEWNGSAWTNATALPEARYNAGGAGIESAGIVLGGSNAPGGTVTFATSVEYNGSSWTAGGTNTAALEGQGMNGTQTACISYGGPTSLTANSSTYDGTTFVTSPNMAANRSALGASKGASITNTMGFGGSTPPNRQMNNTEEFTSEVETANVTDFTTS